MPPLQTTTDVPASIRLADHLRRLNVNQEAFDRAVHRMMSTMRAEALSRDPRDWFTLPPVPARIKLCTRWLWDSLSTPLNWTYESVAQYDGQIARVRCYDLHDLRLLLDLLGLQYRASVNAWQGVIELDILAPLETRHAS